MSILNIAGNSNTFINTTNNDNHVDENNDENNNSNNDNTRIIAHISIQLCTNIHIYTYFQ